MPGDVALYGEHAAIIRYVADVWGVEDREWFVDRVVLGAEPHSEQGIAFHRLARSRVLDLAGRTMREAFTAGKNSISTSVLAEIVQILAGKA